MEGNRSGAEVVDASAKGVEDDDGGVKVVENYRTAYERTEVGFPSI